MTDFWTPDRIETAQRMRFDGYSAAEIAAALGGDCTRNAVIGKLNRLGTAKPRVSKPWTEEQLSTLRAMYLAGESWGAISRAVDHSESVCSHKRAELGLPSRGHTTVRRQVVRKETPPEPAPDDAVGVLDMTGCKWAVGYDPIVPGGHLFCNHAVEGHASYCPYHASVNVTRAPPAPKHKRYTIPTSLLRGVA